MPKRATNIYKRKDGRWEARYVKNTGDPGRKKYGSVYGDSYREARQKQLQYIQTEPVLPRGAGLLLEELMACWLSSIRNKVKWSTYVKYESMVRNHLQDGLGKLRLGQITGAALDRFTAEKLSGTHPLSPKTVNDLLVVLGLAFAYGQQEFGVTLPAVRRVREQPRQMRVLSREEQQALEAYLGEGMDLYKLGVLLTLYTGLRVGELCALRWEDIRGGNLCVSKTTHRIKRGNATAVETTAPKTPSSNRMIPIPSFLQPLIEQHRNEGAFLKTRQGNAVEPRLMQLKFHRYMEDCGLQPANFHALRHTFATRCVEAGFDVKTLSEILGHTDVKTTLNRYVHSSYALKRQNMEKLKPQ